MVEYIDRDAALAALGEEPLNWTGTEREDQAQMDWQLHRNAIYRIPAANVKPVVLCRDCKHKGWIQEPEHGKSVDYCRLIERCVDKQFFCAAGERITNCGADLRGVADDGE